MKVRRFLSLRPITSQRGSGVGTGLAVENGMNVSKWTASLPEALKNSPPLVLSLWFVVHEFSGGNPQTVISFFHDLRSALPNAEIIFGEITALDPELLAQHHESSIVPELLLFHVLSGQGVFSWEIWHNVLKEIPYILIGEREFDVVGNVGEQTTPSSFVWHLRPR